MRRPLAGFGFAYLLSMLVIIQVASAFLLPLAILLAAGFCLFVFIILRAAGRQKATGCPLPAGVCRTQKACLLCGAALSALLVLFAYNHVVLAPLEALENTRAVVQARVEATAPGYGEDTLHAELQVLQINGQPAPGRLRVQARGVPYVTVGQIVQMQAELYRQPNPRVRAMQLGKGFVLGFTVKSPLQQVGYSPTLRNRLRLLQYAAGERLARLLPQRLASVAAAMAFGDRRYIPPQVSTAYSKAGLSHMLVMSGLHLSLLCGLLHSGLHKLVRNKKAASVAGMAGVLLLMAFAGFTPSITRSGVAWLLVFAAPLFNRQGDVYTSLGAAALLLCTLNPYAAADVGLLLSFGATLGALASGEAAAVIKRKSVQEGKKSPPLPLRLLHRLGYAALTPLFVTLATLPVLVWSGMGFSLLSIPANILAVPLLAPIVLCSIVAVSLYSVPLLGVLARLAALGAGALLVCIEKICGLVLAWPGGYFVLEGTFWLVTLLVIYGLVFMGLRMRRPGVFSLSAALVLCCALGLHLWLNTGTVRVILAGGGGSPSLVITRNGQAVVLYRSRLTFGAVKQVLAKQNISGCVLFVDLRQTWESTEYETNFAAQQLVVTGRDVLNTGVYHPLPDVDIFIKQQGKGTLACVDIAGYRIALTTGSVNLHPYGRVDVLVGGQGRVQGEYGLLLAGTKPEWAQPENGMLYGWHGAEFWLRPGTSAAYKEVWDGNYNG